jgi:uncharacterized protein (TIGR00106 family)
MPVGEISVTPIGAGTDTQHHVLAAIDAIRHIGLRMQVGAMATLVQGDVEQILTAARAAHEACLAAGAPRCLLDVKIDERVDKDHTILEMQHEGEPAG